MVALGLKKPENITDQQWDWGSGLNSRQTKPHYSDPLAIFTKSLPDNWCWAALSICFRSYECLEEVLSELGLGITIISIYKPDEIRSPPSIK
jgi:hypothetical protein